MCITNIMLVKTNQVYNNLRAVNKKKGNFYFEWYSHLISWALFLSLVTFLSQIQSITDESRGSVRRKSCSSPQSIGQDVQALLNNDYEKEEVARSSNL